MTDDTKKVSLLRFLFTWIFFFPLFLYDHYRSGHLGIGVLLSVFSPSLWGTFFGTLLGVVAYMEKIDQEKKEAVSKTCTEFELVDNTDEGYACVPKEDVILGTD